MKQASSGGLLLALCLAAACSSEPERREPPSARRPVAVRDGPPRLLVDSVPSDAIVHVDGVVRGTTPVEIADLPAGPHVVTVDGPSGYRDERVVLDRGETRTVVVTSWRARPVAVARSPEDLARAIADAFRTKDRAALERLIPSRDEIGACLGESDPDRARAGLLKRLDEDWASLVEFSGLHKARRLRLSGLEVRHAKLARDPFAREVDAVLAPLLAYDVDGRTMTVKLGPFVRAGDEGWKLLSLLPSRYQ